VHPVAGLGMSFANTVTRQWLLGDVVSADYATRNLAANPTYDPMGQMESGVNAEILIFGADRHAQIF